MLEDTIRALQPQEAVSDLQQFPDNTAVAHEQHWGKGWQTVKERNTLNKE